MIYLYFDLFKKVIRRCHWLIFCVKFVVTAEVTAKVHAARANLASIIGDVGNDHASVIITRKSEATVVMMSLEDYNAM